MSYSIVRQKRLSKNEVFGYFLKLRFSDGLDIAYDGSPNISQHMALAKGHA